MSLLRMGSYPLERIQLKSVYLAMTPLSPIVNSCSFKPEGFTNIFLATNIFPMTPCSEKASPTVQYLGCIGQFKHYPDHDQRPNHDGDPEDGAQRDQVAGDPHHQLSIFSRESDSYSWRI